MFKKIFYFIFSAILILPATALADIDFSEPTVRFSSIEGFLEKIFGVIWTLFTAFSAIMFVSSGVLFLSAQGETGKLTKAKDSFLWGVVGVVVAILAFSITEIIKKALTS